MTQLRRYSALETVASLVRGYFLCRLFNRLNTFLTKDNPQ